MIVLDTSVLIDGLTGLKRSALFPAQSAIPFGPEEAAVSAGFYRAVKRPRGREVDLGIAACALVRGAHLWTLNPGDFRDVPGIRLYASR